MSRLFSLNRHLVQRVGFILITLMAVATASSQSLQTHSESPAVATSMSGELHKRQDPPPRQ